MVWGRSIEAVASCAATQAGLPLGRHRHVRLAVPITAVLRIHLSHIYHPLPRWIAALLVGSAAVGAAAARVADASRL